MSGRGALLFLSLALLGASCSPDFEQSWEVKDLRILAVRAEPPELIFRDVPGAIPPVQIDLLAVDPRDQGRVIDWEAWACTPEESHCQHARYAVKLKTARTPLDQIRISFVPTLELFQASLLADSYKGYGGLPIVVEIHLYDYDHDQVVSAFKRLVYTFPLPYSPVPAEKQPNENPEIGQIKVDDQPIDLTQNSSANPLQADLAAEHVLLPEPTDESKEKYVVVTTSLLDDPGAPPLTTGTDELEEYLSYHFYTTGGSLSHGFTGGPPARFAKENKKVEDVTSTWTAPEETAGDVTLWIVVSDGRGGVSWKTVHARAE